MSRLKFGCRIEIYDLDEVLATAPALPVLREYRVETGKNKNLEMSDSYKVVSAHVHNKQSRVTLIYEGLGSLTFQLKKAISLTNYSQWHGTYKDESFKCQLKFAKKGLLALGDGTNERCEDV